MLFWLVPSAQAIIYTGNPDFGFEVDRPAADLVSGSVDLWKVRIHKCNNAGHVDYVIDDDIDPVDGFEVQIAGGDLCGATLYWDSPMMLQGPSYILEFEDSTTQVFFGSPIPPVALTPYDVVSGSMTGSGPRLTVTID